ncbi:MAG: ornithine carbamoyltransferase [Nitrosomonas sp.]|nr:ornithine carbamoyltransferase [Nitrosomonas sp.]
MQLRHFLQFNDFSREEYEYLFERTRWIKREFKQYRRYWPLTDRTLAMIFDKNSTRTRLSFEAGMSQLGGTAIYLSTRDTQLGRGESVEDAARVMSRMVDIIMIRTHEHDIIKRFSENSSVPVINGLTDEYHPCQIMGDIFTYTEIKGSIAGKTVAWIGDANNMCSTWLQAAELFDFKVHISTPQGYDINPELIELKGTEHFQEFVNPHDAARDADLVTTDVWTSMGFEDEAEKRKKDFSEFCVDSEMMSAAKSDAVFMHCLPAHRGEEVSAEVIDGPQSVVWNEAENRLHAQKALIEYLLLGKIAIER